MRARDHFIFTLEIRDHVYTVEWQHLPHILQDYFVSGAQDLQIIHHRSTLLLVSVWSVNNAFSKLSRRRRRSSLPSRRRQTVSNFEWD